MNAHTVGLLTWALVILCGCACAAVFVIRLPAIDASLTAF